MLDEDAMGAALVASMELDGEGRHSQNAESRGSRRAPAALGYQDGCDATPRMVMLADSSASSCGGPQQYRATRLLPSRKRSDARAEA